MTETGVFFYNKHLSVISCALKFLTRVDWELVRINSLEWAIMSRGYLRSHVGLRGKQEKGE